MKIVRFVLDGLLCVAVLSGVASAVGAADAMGKRGGVVGAVGQQGGGAGAAGQQVGTAGLAPVPVGIFDAKKIFISNAGADSGLFPHPFSGWTDRGYNQFYTLMQNWGRYEIVAEPQQADLVLELQLIAPNGPSSGNKVNGASDPLPMFRLVIFDGKTHYVLWVLTESIQVAALQKTHDRNFDDALTALATDLRGLATKGAAGTP
ncbi:MAG TPA: hypothetical protein VGI16_11690 [Candidatus Acidoferrum sp.]|jgi:hypothetical protein